MRKWWLLVLVLLFGSCHRGIRTFEQIHREPLLTAGVLVIHTELIESSKHVIDLFNSDFTLFGQISRQGTQLPRFDLLRHNILAYYPEYHVIHFLARPKSDSLYVVDFGSGEKLVRKNQLTEFLGFDDYILRYYSMPQTENPIRTQPFDQAPTLQLPNITTAFRHIRITGDWLEVTCIDSCNGCPKGTSLKGWVRWRRNDDIILNLYYDC